MEMWWLCLAVLLVSCDGTATKQLASPTKFERMYKLIPHADHKTRWETSGVCYPGGDYFYTICDNRNGIQKIATSLAPNAPSNTGSSLGDSQLESIACNANMTGFLAGEETVPTGGWEMKVYNSDLHLQRDFHFANISFDHSNTGIEGMTLIDVNNKFYILALCEGNKCQCKKESCEGAGRVYVYQLKDSQWYYEAELDIPSEAGFIDYSGIDVAPTGLTGIVSQSSSKLWVGYLDTVNWVFYSGGTVYDFPKTSGGHTQWCTVEGFAWIVPGSSFVVATDAAKNSMSKHCSNTDQSVAIFEL